MTLFTGVTSKLNNMIMRAGCRGVQCHVASLNLRLTRAGGGLRSPL